MNIFVTQWYMIERGEKKLSELWKDPLSIGDANIARLEALRWEKTEERRAKYPPKKNGKSRKM